MKKYISLFIFLAAVATLVATGHFDQSDPSRGETTLRIAATSTHVSQLDEVGVVPAPIPITSSTTVGTPVPNVPSQPESNIVFRLPTTTYSAYIPPGSKVLDAMRAIESTNNFTFTGHDYPGLGFFVDSINGKKNADGSYWFLYVNGRSSDTGASQTTLDAGDAVEWRYEKNF